MMIQRMQILKHLKDGGRITSNDALNLYGCARLGARIHELRQDGYDIRGVMKPGVNRLGYPTRYKEYWLVMHDE